MKTTQQIVDEIKARLSSIEFMMYWSIDARTRFKKGQRVRLSPLGRSRNFRFKGGAKGGRVVAVTHSAVTVLWDGYKGTKGFFHGFLERAGR